MNKKNFKIFFIVFLFLIVYSMFAHADWYAGQYTNVTVDSGGGMKFQAQIYKTNMSNSIGSYGGTSLLNVTIVNSSGDGVSNASVNVFEATTANFVYGATTDVNGRVYVKLDGSFSNYSIHSGSGGIYNFTVPNKIVLQNLSADTENMTITLTDPTGSAVDEDRAIFVYKNGTQNREYIPVCWSRINNGSGSVTCELDKSNKYDIFYTHSSYSSSGGNLAEDYYNVDYQGILHIWKRSVSLSSPLDVNIAEQNATLNITLIDNDGNGVSGKEINVTVSGSKNLSCRGKTDSNGELVCGINASYAYDVQIQSGANYTNVSALNEFRLKSGPSSGRINFSKLTVTWYGSEGNLITGQRVNVSETSPRGRKSVRDCTGDTNSQGKLYCGLAENNTYDIIYNHSVYNTWHVIRAVSFNSDVNQSISEGNATLNITLKDSDGNVAANQPINVTEQGTNNVSCFGNTDANGVFVCALNASYDYDVHVPSGANYTNVTVQNEFILEDRATPASIPFGKLTVTVRNRYGSIIAGERVDVYETGSTHLTCRDNTNGIGQIYCGLDRGKTYDIMLFNVSTASGTGNATVRRGISVPNNVTISPIVTDVILSAPPTIVTLQGKLTDTSGTTVDTGSMYIEVLHDGDDKVEWSGTFNDVLDSGVFNIGLGTLSEMYLARDEAYNVVIRIDVDSVTYSDADITFGDGAPSDDLIKFVP